MCHWPSSCVRDEDDLVRVEKVVGVWVVGSAGGVVTVATSDEVLLLLLSIVGVVVVDGVGIVDGVDGSTGSTGSL